MLNISNGSVVWMSHGDEIMNLGNEYSIIADVNEDGFVNILDVVLMANILVGGLP